MSEWLQINGQIWVREFGRLYINVIREISGFRATAGDGKGFRANFFVGPVNLSIENAQNAAIAGVFWRYVFHAPTLPRRSPEHQSAAPSPHPHPLPNLPKDPKPHKPSQSARA